MWSVDTEDWRQPQDTSSRATAAIVAAATRGSSEEHPIVLMHDAKASSEPDARVSPNRSNPVAALPAIIAHYRERGYRFVRMDAEG